ncbi:phospholipase A [bacterium]|nr:phospholipase A [bacterium]
MFKIFILSILILYPMFNFAEECEEIRFKKYKRNFIITGFGNDNSPSWWGNNKHNQVKFQFSFKYRVVSQLYFGFTQLSVWDLWNISQSSPFEESNYNPEFFFISELSKSQTLIIGFEHISNGQSKDSGNSRGVNLPNIILHSKWFSFLEQKVKLWFYFEDIIDYFNLIDDSLLENKDIAEYLGYGEIWFNFFISKYFNIEMMLRKGISKNIKQGAIQIGIDFQIPFIFLIKYNLNPKFYFEWFAGYGETLLQYNKGEIQYRLGVMLSF